jgi:hypothetical protein
MACMFVRRLNATEGPRALSCYSTYGCPDIWELENGDFAVIGVDMTEHASKLPASAGCGPTERIVRIPRTLLVSAKPHIPDTL